jgi:hypothetical protein
VRLGDAVWSVFRDKPGGPVVDDLGLTAGLLQKLLKG